MNELAELKYGGTRTFLVNRRLLVDTDWAGGLSKFFACIGQKGIDLKEIQYLLVTHFHPDHMGFAGELAELGIKIVVFEEQKKFIHASDYIFQKDKKTSFKPIDDSRVIFLSCKDSRDFLEHIGICGEVIHTPGHSDDSVSLILDEGIAIVGDLYAWRNIEAYNDSVLNESWNRIIARHVHTVYYGHDKEERL